MTNGNKKSDKNVINLAQAQTKERKLASNDILAMEDELLGTASKTQGGKQSSSGNSTKANGTTTKGTDVKAAIKKFHIPALVQEDYPKIIPLIVETESMDDEEREYWFQILPIMTDEQIKKFVGILMNEKKQLAELDEEYEDELKKINEKHLNEWQEFETRVEREKRAAAEADTEKEEGALEADLLKKLENL